MLIREKRVNLANACFADIDEEKLAELDLLSQILLLGF